MTGEGLAASPAGAGRGADPGGAGVMYCFIGFDGEGLPVELPGGLDSRPWTQVGAQLASVLELDEGDLCFYCLVRTPGGFAASEENGLVADFKLDPARFRHRPEVWRHKKAAAEAFAGAVARLLGREDFQGTLRLFGGAAIAPVPTHRPKSHEFYDSRLADLCADVASGVDGLWLEDAFDMLRVVEPAHAGGSRDSRELGRDIAFSGFSRTPRLVVLVDDVLTRGSHFVACRDLIRERYPGVPVVGVFLAIHRSDFVEYPVEL